MSSPAHWPPPRGVILCGDQIVGGTDLPEPSEPFIEHFNREYAALGLRVQRADAHAANCGGEESPQP